MALRSSPEWLRATREKLRMTQSELAKSLGIERGRLANWEYGRASIPDAFVAKITALEDVSGGGKKRTLSGTPLVPIPVAGTVSAGDGLNNVDPEESTLYVPERLAAIGSVGWVVEGESMMDALHPGDIAVFRPTTHPTRGYTFLLESGDGSLRAKMLDWRENRWTPVSINPLLPAEPLAEGERVVGLLVGWFRSQGTQEQMLSDSQGLRL